MEEVNAMVMANGPTTPVTATMDISEVTASLNAHHAVAKDFAMIMGNALVKKGMLDTLVNMSVTEIALVATMAHAHPVEPVTVTHVTMAVTARSCAVEVVLALKGSVDVIRATLGTTANQNVMTEDTAMRLHCYVNVKNHGEVSNVQ